jgi:SAM-dependent methyltransferase
MRDSGEDVITKVIRHHWDGRASTFDDGIGHGLFSEDQRRAWLDLLSRLVDRPPQRVLDVGSGTGFLALRFAELGHAVTGIDLSPQMIDRARLKAEQAGQQIDFRVGDATALDCPAETYDLVVARHVIWNLPDPERGVAEWLRVLRPGGRLVLIEGKWGDNDASAMSDVLLARVRDAAAPVGLLVGGKYGRRLLNRRYSRVEAHLPFSGGPTASDLAALLEANAVGDVVIRPLMDPRLWGERPRFPRYLAVGTRSDAGQLPAALPQT